MSAKDEDKGFMYKVSAFIVDKRNLFFLIYIIAIIFSIFSSGWVRVNNDITSYLPPETETRQGVVLMDEEFYTFATARIMVSNVTVDTAQELADRISGVEGVSQVEFDDSSDHYASASALLSVTFDGEAEDELPAQALSRIKDILSGYDIYIDSQVGNDLSNTLASEMVVVLAIAALVIVLVLLFTSRTFAEVPVLILTFVAAAILNMGTNFLLGEISFVSNSVTVILQLALAIDYAIILCHRFTEERKGNNAREACIRALSKSIPEICASSLTTISGLAALMFMQFKLGADLGTVLIKAIIFSLLSVFTLMPGLLMLFSKLMDKSLHRNFVPRINFWGKAVVKLRYVVPPVFACLLVAAFIFSSGCPYVFGYSTLSTPKQNENQIAQAKINGAFGSENVMAVLVPAGDYASETRLLNDLEGYGEVKYALGLGNVSVTDDYVLTAPLTPRQFAELVDVDIEESRLLYAAYAVNDERYGEIINGLDSYSVPLLDMYMYLYGEVQSGLVTLDESQMELLDSLYDQLDSAQRQLQGENYSRMLVSLDLPAEGEEMFAFLDTMHAVAGRYYDRSDIFLVGDATSAYDLSSSFSNDNLLITILTIIFVMVILLFTFKSAGLPVLLIIVIQGSIWINFSFPTLMHHNLFFLGYLIVSAIQMGANIDYAIVVSSRYMELKHTMPYKQAMIESLNLAFPTIITSGLILASAGTLISFMTSEPTIYVIGQCVGRGTIISIILVMGVLPEILLLGDSIIERTAFTVRLPEITQSFHGEMQVNGRVRGYVSGVVDANIHGVIRGDVNARVETGSIHTDEEDAE